MHIYTYISVYMHICVYISIRCVYIHLYSSVYRYTNILACVRIPAVVGKWKSEDNFQEESALSPQIWRPVPFSVKPSCSPLHSFF